MNPISLAIVEDNKRFAESIKRALSKNKRFDKIDLFLFMGDFKKADVSIYDLVLLDINLPDGCGLDLIGYVKNRSPDTEIIILTTFADEDKLFIALRSGASGYITKANTLRYIEESIDEVMAGGAVISPDMAGRFLNYFSSFKRENVIRSDAKIELTKEEIEVIEILARGLTNREISEALKIRYRYVKTILSKIYKKFGTSSRSEVVRKAIEMGIIEI